MSLKVKMYVCEFAARSRENNHDVVREFLRRLTGLDIMGWFRHVGLCATHV